MAAALVRARLVTDLAGFTLRPADGGDGMPASAGMTRSRMPEGYRGSAAIDQKRSATIY